MAKKKTHEEFVKDLNKVHGEGVYVPLEKYKGVNVKILIKHICGYEWKVVPHNLLRGYGCPICANSKRKKRLTKTHEKFIKEVDEKYNGEYKVLGRYINDGMKILVSHNLDRCNYKWKITPSNLLQGNGCPVCANKKAVIGINTIWDTDRWMINLGVSKEDAKKHTRCSNKKVIVKCPDCGRKKKITISQIYANKSISCSCGDGKSYPEKFVMNLLEQLNLEFEIEYLPIWIDNKRYDFYIEDLNMIIETHGSQHYKNGFKGVEGARILAQEQENDKYKRKIALQNGIKNYITLDCRKSEVGWIKNSILNSELSKLFNLSNIDWNKCAEFANKNIVKEICEYWNNKREDKTTSDLGKIFKLDRATISRYLSKGNKLEWCNYDPKEEKKKIGIKVGKLGSKKVEIFKNNKSLGIFSSCRELDRQSEKLFGVKLTNSSISLVCNGKQNTYKGFTFKYVD